MAKGAVWGVLDLAGGGPSRVGNCWLGGVIVVLLYLFSLEVGVRLDDRILHSFNHSILILLEMLLGYSAIEVSCLVRFVDTAVAILPFMALINLSILISPVIGLVPVSICIDPPLLLVQMPFRVIHFLSLMNLAVDLP